MRRNKLIFALAAMLILSSCEGYQLGGPFADKPAGYKGGSMCKKEVPLQLEYAPQQYMTVPTCQMSDFFVADEVKIAKQEGWYEPFGVVDEKEVRDAEQIIPIKLYLNMIIPVRRHMEKRDLIYLFMVKMLRTL